ncbi:MAG: PepSY domain-containing protein [Erysipelotrichaceae bacterium]|jgi:uncharacterized membrane protein YkoI
MTPEKIKERIRKAVQKVTPDISEQIIQDAEKNIYKAKKEKRNVFSWKPALVLATSCLLFVTIFVYWPAKNVVAATISLDINPSIEISLDENDKVVEIVGKNSEGKEVIEGLNVIGCEVNTALTSLINALVKHGYLNDSANSILVTVNNEDMTTDIMEMLQEALSEEDFAGSVVCQNLRNDPKLVELANKYNISIGRAQLITELIELDDTYQIEELVKLNVNQLNLLLGNPENKIPGLKRMGQPSEKEYIGQDKAKETAFESVGAVETEISDYSCEIEYRHRNIVYIIKFVYNNTEYAVMVNGTSGAVLECEQENRAYKHQYGYGNNSSNRSGNGNSDTNGGNGKGSGNNIGSGKAKRIALQKANAYEYHNYSSKLCNQDGKLVYCIEFEANNRNCRYVIDAHTGEILEEK